MNYFTIFIFLSIIIIFSTSTNVVFGQIDPLSDISFFQSGELQTTENQFLISNEFNIRELSSGNIIRVSGQTIEGFPYITYSKISNGDINTRGVIFVNGKFVDLSFIENPIVPERIEKNNDLVLLVQYSQSVYSREYVQVDVKLYDKEQNKSNDYYQNYGYVADVDIKINITNANQEIIFSSNGTTNERGFFETRYLLPDNSIYETLTISINAENEESITSKILQVFSLGNPSKGGSSS